MNLQELMNQINSLGGQIRALSSALAAAAMDSNASMDSLKAQQDEVDKLRQRLAILQAEYDQRLREEQGNVQQQAQNDQPPRELREMLASNEYARAFAFALRNGLNRRTARNHEEARILYDALTESGGTPTGSDGGFLVPEDIDHSIRELMRDLNPLAPLFNVESVTAPTGWRVVDTAPTSGFTAVNEMGTVPSDDQPLFSKVPYTVSKYGLILPISNELMADNVANLFGYVSQWFAKKLVITQNGLLVTALRTLTATDITSDPLGGIKKALNVDLDPAISRGATVITSQNGYNALDQLVDELGRGLLQPDPTAPTAYLLKGRPVHVVSNATLADVSGAADVFIGSGAQFATLFECGGFEIASTDIGGNAWKSDSTEVRGIVRMAVATMDEGAMVRRAITV